MDRKPYVVIGEAPESDSEEEINVQSVTRNATSNNPKGMIIEGEAPESEEEHDDADGGSVSSAASVASMPSLASATKKEKSTKSTKRNDKLKYNTLLHKRLRERNFSLRTNIYNQTRQLIADNEKELNSLDQQLLRSQGVVQESVATLRAMQGELMQLCSKLVTLTSSTFLPRIQNMEGKYQMPSSKTRACDSI